LIGIAYCGIDCVTCEYVDELKCMALKAADLSSDLKRVKVSVWAPTVLEGGSEIDFQRLEKSLDWIADSLTCPGCKRGGGLQDCSVRLCSKDMGFQNCSECSELIECSKFDHLIEPDKIKNRLLEMRRHT
jgi:hypothetical protein